MTIINESGLYTLIFGSKLESAEKFKHWVTSEVLPSIRKNGYYGEKPHATLHDVLEMVNMMRSQMESQGIDARTISKAIVETTAQYNVKLPDIMIAPEKATLGDIFDMVDFIAMFPKGKAPKDYNAYLEWKMKQVNNVRIEG